MLKNHKLPLRRLIGNVRHRYVFAKRMKQATPVFIYQMAKCGSTTLVNSLKEEYRGMVFRAHELHANHESREIRLLYKYIVKNNFPVKVISILRDPVSKNIAHFFQGYEAYTGLPFEKFATLSSEQIQSLFLNGKEVPHNEQETWFDENFLKNFNINVFDYPFPKEEGYTVISKNNIEILLIKLELPDEKKEKLIARFLNMESVKLKNANEGDKKIYKEQYSKFKKEAKLPAAYLNRIYSTPYAHHFYTAEEIKKARAVWE